MRHCWMIIFLLCGAINGVAQEDLRREYEQFRKQQMQEFRDYVSRENREYADFLKQEWKLFQSMQAIKRPEEPKPDRPPFVPDRGIPEVPGPVVGTLPLPKVIVPKPEKRPEVPQTLSEKLTVHFYGVDAEISFTSRLKVTINNVSEKSVGDYWEKMSTAPYEDFIKALKGKAEIWGLNDWGYYRLTETISREVFSDDNDRTAFVFYILKQSGYDLRLGRGGERLYLLLSFTTQVYGIPYFMLDGQKYYCLEGSEGTLYTFGKTATLATGKAFDLHQYSPLAISGPEKVRKLRWAKYPELNVSIPYNPGQLAYYNDIPQTELSVYFSYPMPTATWKALYEVFNPLAVQHSLPEFVGILLNFVQTAFEYQTDNEQFGREKYFYPEEVIAYPFCDCEDRSVFFACLIQNLTGLKVIGLDYPGHIATAVCFGDTDIQGDSFLFQKKRYVICDPTYINASVGMTMPQFRKVTPEVITY